MSILPYLVLTMMSCIQPDVPIPEACQALLSLSESPQETNSERIQLSLCEAFYSNHATEAQREQLQCIAKVEDAEKRKSCFVKLPITEHEHCECTIKPANQSYFDFWMLKDRHKVNDAELSTSFKRDPKAMIIGSMPKEDISRALHVHWDRLQECTSKSTEHSVTGQIKVSFVVKHKTGQVRSVKVKSSELNQPRVESCILARLSTLYVNSNIDIDTEVVSIVHYTLTFE